MVRKILTSCLLVTGLIVVLGAIVKRGYFSGVESGAIPIHVNGQGQLPTESAAAHTLEEKPTSGNTRSGPDFSASIAGVPSNGKSLVPATASVGLDASVVGSPFNVSPSVSSRCKGFLNCDEISKKLSDMAREPRDKAWATEMETKLQDEVMSQGPDKYSIRNIECRASICALEVASVFGTYIGPGYGDSLNLSLSNGIDTMWGYEIDARGVKTTVTLTTFTRR
jgi:hypothetical protein